MTTSRMGIMGSLRVSNFSLICVTSRLFGSVCLDDSSSTVLFKDYHVMQARGAKVIVGIWLCKLWNQAVKGKPASWTRYCVFTFPCFWQFRRKTSPWEDQISPRKV